MRVPVCNKRARKRLRMLIAEEARRHLGKPYLYGAYHSEAPSRFDCSSFVQYLYNTIGVAIPRVSIEQARKGRVIRSSQETVEIGDLIFLRSDMGRYDRQFPDGVGHVMIVTGLNEVIHARSKKPSGVVRQRLSTVLSRKDITVIRRIL